MQPRPARPTLFPYTTLFRSTGVACGKLEDVRLVPQGQGIGVAHQRIKLHGADIVAALGVVTPTVRPDIGAGAHRVARQGDRKSTRLNSSHTVISYAVFCLKK